MLFFDLCHLKLQKSLDIETQKVVHNFLEQTNKHWDFYTPGLLGTNKVDLLMFAKEFIRIFGRFYRVAAETAKSNSRTF